MEFSASAPDPTQDMFAEAEMRMTTSGPTISRIQIGYDDQRDGWQHGLSVRQARALYAVLGKLLQQLETYGGPR